MIMSLPDLNDETDPVFSAFTKIFPYLAEVKKPIDGDGHNAIVWDPLLSRKYPVTFETFHRRWWEKRNELKRQVLKQIKDRKQKGGQACQHMK